MYDLGSVSEFEVSPDGLLRKNGRIVPMPEGMPGSAPALLDVRALGSVDANAEAARRHMQLAQTPQPTASLARS
jgi:hypothetical protein